MDLGIQGKACNTVNEGNTALAVKSGGLNVFATPSVAALMEEACYESIGNLLDEDQTTVGVSISVKHIAATKIGKRVYADSVLTHVEGNRLTFEVTAYDEDKKIAFGTHERVIVDTESFLNRLN